MSTQVKSLYVVTFDPRPICGPGSVDYLRRMTLAEARETLRIAARIPMHGRIVDVDTLEVVV